MAGAARQPLLWLVAALPVAAIVGGIWMTQRARGPLDASPDAVKRVAQIQTTDESRDRRALELGASAELDLESDRLVVRSASDAVTDDATLQLELVHATDATQDRTLALTACGARQWCAQTTLADARFRFELHPTSNEWRIVGARELGQQHITLTPAWSPQ